MRSYLYILFILFSIGTTAQVDTTLVIDSISVYSYKSIFQPEQATTGAPQPDRIIENGPSTYLRNYGPGSISTLSLKGGNSNQTLVTWQDIPIVHPMLGLYDFSLIPKVLTPTIQISPNGSPTLDGPGAIGGTVALQSPNPKGKVTELNTRMGSFYNIGLSLRQDLTYKKFSSSSLLDVSRGLNNFDIETEASQRKQSNAQTESLHLVQKLRYNFSPSEYLEANLWLLQNNRSIPPLITQTKSIATQRDQATRIHLKYAKLGRNIGHEWSTAYLRDFIHYEDPQIRLSAESTSESGHLRFRGWFSPSNKHTLGWGLSSQYIKGMIDDYDADQEEWRSQVNLNYRLQLDHISMSSGVLISARNQDWAPLAPELTMNIHPSPSTQLGLTFKRNFRWPALNDLHWARGGNPELLPEQGWEQILSFHTSHNFKDKVWKLDLLAFHRKMDNWIQWGLLEQNPFFSAYNLTEVRSYGTHFESSILFPFQKTQTFVSLQYDWVRSIHLNDIDNPKIQKGEQLPYTPEHQWHIQLEQQFTSWTAGLQYQYFSSTIGLNDDLESYNLLGFFLRRNWASPGIRGHLTLHINNLTNQSYFIIERRPMPLSNFEVVFNLKI